MRRRVVWLLAGALGVTAAGAAGCRVFTGGGVWYDQCREAPAAQKARSVPSKSPPAPAHPDYERLLAYRNYYRLERVTPFAHRFAVWFSCIEQSVDYYAVSPEGVVSQSGGAWGGLAVRDGKPAEVPEALRGAAKLVRDAHDARYEHESGERVEYIGSYREVEVTELVPQSGPGDPYTRMVGHTSVTLRANESLTWVDGFARAEGGETRMCWRDLLVLGCGPAYWIDFAPNTGGGVGQLPALVKAGSPQPSAERVRFTDAALAAARAYLAKEPSPSLESILARQGSSVLPPGFTTPLNVGFTIYARVADAGVPDGSHKQQEAALKLAIPTLELLRGGARATGTVVIAGVGITAVVDVKPTEVLPPDASGASHASLQLHYTLTDGRGNTRSADVTLKAEALVDGDAAVLTLSPLSNEITSRTHEPPLGQHFPGAGGYSSLDVYVGFSSGHSRWWP